MKGRLQFVVLAVMFAGGAMWLGEGRAVGSGGPLLPAPDYDSGWVAVVQSGTLVLEHNLDTSTDNMMVDLQFKASPQLGLAGINNQFYGTSAFGAPPYISGYLGAHWSGLTENRIHVFREGQDLSAEQVRVRIWLHK